MLSCARISRWLFRHLLSLHRVATHGCPTFTVCRWLDGTSFSRDAAVVRLMFTFCPCAASAGGLVLRVVAVRSTPLSLLGAVCARSRADLRLCVDVLVLWSQVWRSGSLGFWPLCGGVLSYARFSRRGFLPAVACCTSVFGVWSFRRSRLGELTLGWCVPAPPGGLHSGLVAPSQCHPVWTGSALAPGGARPDFTLRSTFTDLFPSMPCLRRFSYLSVTSSLSLSRLGTETRSTEVCG